MVVVALDMPMDVSSSIIMVVMVVIVGDGGKTVGVAFAPKQNQWLKLFGMIGPESLDIPAFIFIGIMLGCEDLTF